MLIALNIFGVFTLPGTAASEAPLGSGQKFDLKYFLTFTVFPILIFLNLVFWVITAVSGRMFISRPEIRQAMQVFYVILTIALVGVLFLRMI